MRDEVIMAQFDAVRSRFHIACGDLCEYWRDEVAERFSREFIEPLDKQLDAAKANLAELAAVTRSCWHFVDKEY